MKINFKILAFIIIFVSIIEPDYFASVSIIHNYYLVMRVLLLFIAIMYLFLKRIFPTITFVIVIYFLIYFIATYINKGDLFSLLGYSTSVISFVIWLEISLKHYTFQALYSLNFVYSALVYINFILYFLFPNGLNQEVSSSNSVVHRYFLGVENQFAATLIPALIINVIYNYTKHNRLRINSYFLLTVILLTLIYSASSTSIVGIILFIIYLFLISKIYIKQMITNTSIILSVVILYLLIVVFDLVKLFSFLIENLLNKDLTLSTRTALWERAFVYIQDSPMLGYGYLSGGRYLRITSFKSMDAHNTVLQLLLQHGFVGIIILLILLIWFFRNTSKFKNNKINLFIMFSFFVVTTMMISEAYSFTFILLVVILGITLPYIIKEYDIRRLARNPK